MGRSKRGRSSQSRRPPIRDQKARILLYSEGQRTEPGYLDGLRSALRTNMLIEEERTGASPGYLVKAAVKKLKSLERGSKDQIWVVFDRDEHPDYHVAVQMAQAHGLRCAVSNPCIELWLLLHFQDQKVPLERDEALDELKRHIPRYGKVLDKAVCALLFADLLDAEGLLRPDSRVQQAITRAERLLAEDAWLAREGNPSTQFHQLVKAILDLHKPGK